MIPLSGGSGSECPVSVSSVGSPRKLVSPGEVARFCPLEERAPG